MPSAAPNVITVFKCDREAFKGFRFLSAAAGSTRREAVLRWITDSKLVRQLRRFKSIDVDTPIHYEQLRTYLGADSTKWDRCTDDIVELAQDPMIDVKETDRQPVLTSSTRLVKAMRQLADVTEASVGAPTCVSVKECSSPANNHRAQVPGESDYGNGTKSARTWRMRMVWYLLLDVLHDLQYPERTHGYWATRLRGPRVTPWKADTKSELLTRPAIPAPHKNIETSKKSIGTSKKNVDKDGKKPSRKIATNKPSATPELVSDSDTSPDGTSSKLFVGKPRASPPPPPEYDLVSGNPSPAYIEPPEEISTGKKQLDLGESMLQTPSLLVLRLQADVSELKNTVTELMIMNEKSNARVSELEQANADLMIENDKLRGRLHV